MDNQLNFHYAITLALQLYDVEGDEEDLEETGLVAYNFIGNKNTRLKKASLHVDCDTGIVKLPCDVGIIEAVTYCGPEDWNYTSNTKEYGDFQSFYTENYIESRKAFLDPHYISGRFVKYKRVGDTLYVNKGFGKINILYHEILVDEDGLPFLNDKEAVAISEFIAYNYYYKKALKTNDANTLRIAKDLQLKWLFHCDAARVPENISQNEMNSILDSLSSWNRKVYNKSLKPTL